MFSDRWIRALDLMIGRFGDTVTLQRLAVDAAGTPTVSLAATCPAFVRAAAPQDIIDGGAPDTRVVLSVSSLGAFGVPQRDDRILIAGETANIMEVAPFYIGGALVRVNLLCRGNG